LFLNGSSIWFLILFLFWAVFLNPTGDWPGSRTRSRVLTRSPGFDRVTGNSGQPYFLYKSKQCRFSKKKIINGFQLDFLLGFAGFSIALIFFINLIQF
jgi:hypothetical protein